MSTSEIHQKVILDNKEYIQNAEKGSETIKRTTNESNVALTENSKSFAQNEQQVKTWGQTMQEEFKKFKKSFIENLATGAKVVTLDAGFHALHKGASDAAEMLVDADKRFAEFRSRVNASDEQLKKWKDTIAKTAIDTKTNIASMEQAFMDLSDSADPEQISQFMKEIGQATLLAHGNQGAVTDFVKKSLTEQGLEFNEKNVEGTLTAADVLRRRGRGYGTMESAMGALSGLDQQSIKSSGLGERGVAALLAGASKNMSTSQASAGVGALLDANKNGIQQGSVLAGILGVSGKNGLMGANGQMDISKVANQGSYNRLMKLGGGDENKAMEIFRAISGLGPEASDALFKMIKNFKDMNATVAEANADQKKLALSAEQAGDNIQDMYQQMQDKFVVGFEDILEPLKGPLKAILGGHPGDALKETPAALAGTAKGIIDHPLLAVGAVLGTATAGSLANSLMKSFGLGGAGNVAKGLAMKQAGVEPVFVVNADEIGDKSSGGFFSKFKKMLPSVAGLGELAGTSVATAGAGAIAGTAALGAGIGIAGGAAINYGLDKTSRKDQYGRKTDYLESAIGWAANKTGVISDKEYQQRYGMPQKVEVVITSTDGRFDVKPKASDTHRDGRVH